MAKHGNLFASSILYYWDGKIFGRVCARNGRQDKMFEDRVAKGVALLSERLPDWENAINIATLDMGCPQKCVLGQQFGSYIKGAEALHLFTRECPEYGFILYHSEPDRLESD